MFALAACLVAHQVTHTFAIKDGNFLLDGKPFQVVAGEMHYPRIPEAYWRHRIQMAKAMGLNTISIYCFWNFHETERGKFDFSGGADVAKFVRIAQQEKMWVVVRPGPYVCAEWEYGGYPYWLQNIPGCVVRKNNPAFLREAAKYMKELGKQLAPLQVTRGGNILMFQVENEYGSFDSDKAFLAATLKSVKDSGIDVPLFTADGEGQMPAGKIEGILPGWNGGSWPRLKAVVDNHYPGGPYFVPELYPGWLCHWGEKFPRNNGVGMVRQVENIVKNGASMTLYMFHGGTNFGFWNGANFGGNYQPHITSYDYDAPCDEAGGATPKYKLLREMLMKYAPSGSIPPVPAPIPVITIPRTTLKPVATVLDLTGKITKSSSPLPMEKLGQGYGFVLYRHLLKGTGAKILSIEGIRDYAVVMLDGKSVGTLDRRRREKNLTLKLQGKSAHRLEILVENGGRVNFGQQLLDNLKGIVSAVTLDGEGLKGWEQVSLPMATVPTGSGKKVSPNVPTIYHANFQLTKVGDTYLDLRGWTKGVVWVNGQNIGRYFKIGPQQTLFVPGVWLKKGKNTVTVFELVETKRTSIEGLNKAVLDENVPEVAKTKTPRATAAPKFETEHVVIEGEFKPGNDWQTMSFAQKSGRFLCFETLSTFGNEDFATAAEIQLVGVDGKPINRSKWKVVWTDSEETLSEDGSADNLIDGDRESIWHSIWSQPHKGQPHRVVIDLGANTTATGFRYLPRSGGVRPGMTKGFRVYLKG